MKQTFKKVKIELTAYDIELSKAGWKIGDVVDGSREFINGKAKSSVWFSAKRSTTTNCVAYLDYNCKLVEMRD